MPLCVFVRLIRQDRRGERRLGRFVFRELVEGRAVVPALRRAKLVTGKDAG